MDAVASAGAGALLGGALWLLHPLFLSTTLYIVQRETMLATFFVLIGFLAWIAGRRRVLGRRYIGGGALLITGSLVCTGLAALCKANGLLLPLLLLVAEGFVLIAIDRHSDVVFLAHAACAADRPGGRAIGNAGVDVAALRVTWPILSGRGDAWPTSLVGTAGVAELPGFDPAAQGPSAVVFSTIIFLHLLDPASSVQHDTRGIAGSRPDSYCMAVSSALLRSVLRDSFLFRRPGLGIDCCTARNCISEHRNYLPAMPLFWPLAVWLTAPGKLDRLRYTAAALLVMGLALDTHSGAQIWGDPPRLALAWAAYNP